MNLLFALRWVFLLPLIAAAAWLAWMAFQREPR